jgi:hypothetical protein
MAAAAAGLLVGFHGLTPHAAARDLPGRDPALRASEAAVAQWLEQNRHRPTALRAFVQRLPKGGDLHSHLSGAVYAENYLEWAARDGYCVDPAVPTLVKPSDCNAGGTLFAASELVKKPTVYDKFVNLWSTRNLPFAGRSGHDQFFQAFAGFDLISGSLSRQDDMVAEVANRAASQHVFYLELMITLQGGGVRKLGQQVGWNGDFARTRQQLLEQGLLELVRQGEQDLQTIRREASTTMACGTPQAQPGCGVTVRYLQQTTRSRPPEEVFAQFVYAFELAKASNQVVGINLVAPEEILDTDGADALRLAHLFVGPPQDDVDWEGVGLDGCSRFLQRLWRLATGRVGPESLQRDPSADDDQIERSVHRLIARVSDDYERWSYNTAVAACMEMTNELYRYVQAASPPRRETIDFGVDTLLLLLAPMAPHLTAELWEQRRGGHIHEEQWPTPDPSKLAVETVTMVVQVNGKVRDRIEVSAGIGEDEARALALSSPKVMAAADGREPRSVVCRPPRLVNVVL